MQRSLRKKKAKQKVSVQHEGRTYMGELYNDVLDMLRGTNKGAQTWIETRKKKEQPCNMCHARQRDPCLLCTSSIGLGAARKRLVPWRRAGDETTTAPPRSNQINTAVEHEAPYRPISHDEHVTLQEVHGAVIPPGRLQHEHERKGKAPGTTEGEHHNGVGHVQFLTSQVTSGFRTDVCIE